MQGPSKIITQLMVCGFLIAGCGASVADAPLEVATSSIQPDAILFSVQMSAPWLTDLNLDPGQIVVVSSDQAVLSLDADALALLATKTLKGQVLEPGTVWDPAAPKRGAEIDLVTVEGRPLPLRFADSKIYIADMGVEETIEWNGVTVVVVDGVFLE